MCPTLEDLMKGFVTMIQSWRLLTRLGHEQGSGGFLAAPPLMSNCSNPPFATQRRSCRLESCLQGMGDKKASVPRSPTGPCSHQNSAKCYLAVWMGGSVRRMGTCICMAESLCCPPESITTLFLVSFSLKKKLMWLCQILIATCRI